MTHEMVDIDGRTIILYRAIVEKAYYVENAHNAQPLWHIHNRSDLFQAEARARAEVEYLTGLYCPPATGVVP